MARKRPEKEMPATAEPKTKPVRLDLPPDVHHMLRIVAAEEAKPMAVFAREIVAEVVAKRYGAIRPKGKRPGGE